MAKWLRAVAIALTLLWSTAAGAQQSMPYDLSAVGADRVLAANRLQQWQALMRRENLTDDAKLAAVNGFFNALRQQDDIETWGVPDYWASPEELLTAGAGDCEDFAVAKYVTLLAMGIAASRLRLALAYAYGAGTGRIERHLVLIYRAPGEPRPRILDNLTPRIADAGQRADLSIVRWDVSPQPAPPRSPVPPARAPETGEYPPGI